MESVTNSTPTVIPIPTPSDLDNINETRYQQFRNDIITLMKANYPGTYPFSITYGKPYENIPSNYHRQLKMHWNRFKEECAHDYVFREKIPPPDAYMECCIYSRESYEEIQKYEQEESDAFWNSVFFWRK